MQPIDLSENDIMAIWETQGDSFVLAETFQIPQKLVDLIKEGKYGSKYTKDLVAPKQRKKVVQSKLTQTELLEIFNSSDSAKILAARYNVSANTIRNARTGRTWADFKSLPKKSTRFSTHGETHSTSVLTEVQVKEIIQLFPTHSNAGLAAMYDVSESCISSIRTGVSWTHLTKGQRFKKSNGLRSNKNPNRKLTPEAIQDIWTSSASNAELAVKYGVKHRAIWSVRAGRTWKNSKKMFVQ